MEGLSNAACDSNGMYTHTPPSDDEMDEQHDFSQEQEEEEDATGGMRSRTESFVAPSYEPPKRVRFEYADWPAKKPASAPEPDLALFFSNFGLDDVAQIAICRTYASYLAARTRSGVRGPYKRAKKIE